jgi:hypothetical protein
MTGSLLPPTIASPHLAADFTTHLALVTAILVNTAPADRA